MNSQELFGNIAFPESYKEPILQALEFYPELKDEHITFKMVKRNAVPYSTMPEISSIFKKSEHRRYLVLIAEKSKGPEQHALFKNLPEKARVGMIAHELGHVLQYRSLSSSQLVLLLMSYMIYPWKRAIERNADKLAILHGAGDYLYEHTCFIRAIPGYLQQRPQINHLYLKPNEIKNMKKELYI